MGDKGQRTEDRLQLVDLRQRTEERDKGEPRTEDRKIQRKKEPLKLDIEATDRNENCCYSFQRVQIHL
jgi:hypothetical protein